MSAVYSYNVNVALGNVLRKYRERRGFTQDEFATCCGLSRAYYGRVERGEHSLTIEKCQMIATTLNVRLADLFGELQE
ncbi:helix-turn-helix domain-containing protein [Intestinimonas butyriciproducens]|uniref:helix-turn-helix domain-containing protein n=1 Tax=Intestinimonas butyriciproducens TaxID=1297617 RepID=UPI003C6D3009